MSDVSSRIVQPCSLLIQYKYKEIMQIFFGGHVDGQGGETTERDMCSRCEMRRERLREQRDGDTGHVGVLNVPAVASLGGV